VTDDISTRLAANLKRLRETRGLSQASLAESSGVPRPTIAHLESGQANPTLSVVLRVAAALGVSVDGLVDPGEAPLIVSNLKEFSTKKTQRTRRVQLLAGGALRDPEIEWIVAKPEARLRFEGEPTCPQIFVVLDGRFQVSVGVELGDLGVEEVAWVRGEAVISSVLGGALLRIVGRNP
jgi:XRE family transcriptional regulator, regulator of sulfur utilization